MSKLIPYIPCVVCFGVSAAILLTKGGEADGWGWFMLLGVITVPDLKDVVRFYQGG